MIPSDTGNYEDNRPNLHLFTQPGTVKLGNTSLVVRPNYGKVDLKLFVGQLPKEWNEDMVTEFFRNYGDILESQIIRDSKSGQSKGCAFVKFASMTKAEEAKHSIESSRITLPGVNNVIQIKWADGEEQRLGVDENTIPKLFVGSFPRNATEENLKDIFSLIGTIEELALMKEADGRSKGCAFIKFKLKEDALIAVRILNGNVFIMGSDKPIEVRLAEKKPTKDQAKEMPVVQPMYNPMMSQTTRPQVAFYKYMSPEGAPYYWNPYTKETQWDEPPPGSYVIPEMPEMPYYVKLQTSSDPTSRKPGSNLFIFHLPIEWSENDLLQNFNMFGKILSCRIMTDKATGRSKGFGFLSYETQQQAQAAIDGMNGFQVGKKKLKVEFKKGDGDDENYGNSSGGEKFTSF